MSPSEKKGNVEQLHVRTHDQRKRRDHDARIRIFDGNGALCGEGNGELSIKVPKGLYTARIERFGEMREEVVVHRGTTTKSLIVPSRNSAMPMSDTRHTHEFLSKAARKYSRKSTFKQPPERKNWPRLMIMLRASGDNSDEAVQFSSSLSLFDERGKKVSDFGEDQTQSSEPNLYGVYSALLMPGNYVIASMKNERRHMLPVSLYNGWDSFIFIPHQQKPRLPSSSIKMVKHNAGYDPKDKKSAAIDAALLGLGSRLNMLRPEDRNHAIYGKFTHPLLGLIGAHSHFLNSDRKEKLEKQVLRNLWKLMPGSPDVIALLLMALDRDHGKLPRSMAALDRASKTAFGEKISNRLPLNFPPMLNSALQAIMRATRELPDLVKEGSWLETAGNSSFGSGVWAMWDQPAWSDPATEKSQLGSSSNTLPSTQRLYPLVKTALAEVSERTAGEIIAKLDLNEIIRPTKSNIGDLMLSVAEKIPDYTLQGTVLSVDGLRTVRDLVTQVQEAAQPRSADSPIADSANIESLPEVENWLVDLVHDRIDQGEFDSGSVAKRYAVSKHSVERAAKLPRPPDLS